MENSEKSTKKRLTFLERELNLCQELAFEKTKIELKSLNVPDNILIKVMETLIKNLNSVYRRGKKKNEAEEYLEQLLKDGKIEEETFEKFLEFIDFRETIKNKPFNTPRMVNGILKPFEKTSQGHLRACIDYAIEHSYLGVKVEYIAFKNFVDNDKKVENVVKRWGK